MSDGKEKSPREGDQGHLITSSLALGTIDNPKAIVMAFFLETEKEGLAPVEKQDGFLRPHFEQTDILNNHSVTSALTKMILAECCPTLQWTPP